MSSLAARDAPFTRIARSRVDYRTSARRIGTSTSIPGCCPFSQTIRLKAYWTILYRQRISPPGIGGDLPVSLRNFGLSFG